MLKTVANRPEMKSSSQVSFSSRFSESFGLAQHLVEHVEVIPQIKAFKQLVSMDKARWFVSLGSDGFPKATSAPGARDNLIKELARDNDSFVRGLAARATINVSDPKVRDELIRKLAKDRNTDVRRRAAEATRWMSDPKAAAELITQLAKDKAGTVKFWCSRAAGFLSDSKVSADLVERLLKHEDRAVRSGAEVTVGNICDPNAAAELIKRFSSKGHSFDTRRHVIESASFIEDANVRDELVAAIAKDDDPNVKGWASSISSRVKNRIDIAQRDAAERDKSSHVFHVDIRENLRSNDSIGKFQEVHVKADEPLSTFDKLASGYRAIVDGHLSKIQKDLGIDLARKRNHDAVMLEIANSRK